MPMSRWASRALALALLVVTVAALFLGVVQPLIDAYARTDATMAEARDLLQRYERIAARRADLDREAAALIQAPANENYYLTGGNETLAAAMLQGNVTALIGSNGAAVGSVQTLPPQEEQGLVRVAIRVQMVGHNEALLRILHNLESGKPLLFLDNVTIASRGANGTGPVERTLSVAFDLYGYLRPTEAAGAAP